MKKLALLALMPLLLLSCRNDTASSNTEQNTQTETTQNETQPNETAQNETEQTDTAQSETENTAEEPQTASEALENLANQTNETEAPSETAKPAGVPSGYTRVADLNERPVRTFRAEPALQLEQGKDYAVVLDTTKGQIVIDLFEDVPTTVNSFVFLARNNFYDGISFHRVIDGFVVQGGDPNTLKSDRNTWGQGGPGYEIPLEVRTKYNFDEKGILGMARAQDPNSGGSQFYITLAPATNLNGQYTVFGKVVQGLDVLDQITKYEAPAEGTPDKMLDVYVVTKN